MQITSIHNLAYARFFARCMPAGSDARRIAAEAGRAARNHREDLRAGTTYEEGGSLGPSRDVCAAIVSRLDPSVKVSRKVAEFSATQMPPRVRERVERIIRSLPDDFTLGELVAAL